MRGHVFAPTTADARVPTSLVRRAESSANPLLVAAGVRPVASTEDAASDLWRASAAPAVQRNGSSRLWVDAAAGLARSGGHQGFPPASIAETVLIQLPCSVIVRLLSALFKLPPDIVRFPLTKKSMAGIVLLPLPEKVTFW